MGVVIGRQSGKHASMDKRLLRAYLLRRAQEQQEIIDSVRVFSKRHVSDAAGRRAR